MGTWELFLIAAGLAMDAFAVALCRGLAMQLPNMKQTLAVAITFGGFQALMPLLGWLLGRNFEQYIVSIDHWIAFILLSIIGGKMIYEACKKEQPPLAGDLKVGALLLMALATSIDALAVGITFAFLKTDIVLAITVIGIVTFALSFVGVVLGRRFGIRYKSKAEIAGGIVLILIGTKILLEHLGILT